jgi:hypothetical protein
MLHEQDLFQRKAITRILPGDLDGFKDVSIGPLAVIVK